MIKMLKGQWNVSNYFLVIIQIKIKKEAIFPKYELYGYLNILVDPSSVNKFQKVKIPVAFALWEMYLCNKTFYFNAVKW